MYTIIWSSEFNAWFETLRDLKARSRIVARLRSATYGNFGDCKPVGEGVSEMRVNVGAGYRVYYMRTELTVYVLLTGGDKSSQNKDIARAKQLAHSFKEK